MKKRLSIMAALALPMMAYSLPMMAEDKPPVMKECENIADKAKRDECMKKVLSGETGVPTGDITIEDDDTAKPKGQ